MHDNCQPESSAVAADSLRLAVNALAEFPVRAGAENVAGRISVVAALCEEVERAMDSLIVRTAAEAAEEGWTTGRMRETAPGYHARLQRALASADEEWTTR
ncbi:hypothetical protein ACFYNO_09810 [Kitasatospora sp. NPDC006697]|uniref:hypothetical protein n=1 Tax=Kitasatospora sp. NPDC006697 TaxID=3364020 RepID=UPI0036BAEE88